MVVVSTLRAAGMAMKCLPSPLARYSLARVPKFSNNLACVRSMSEGRSMRVAPSRFEWQRWKDHVHYFLALGLIPMGILITYVNIFIGPSELTEIPEDYEPDHWEYHKHPIQRWFSRYVYDNPQKCYEISLHIINQENQKRMLRLTEKKVRALMAERQDIKGWYYVPVNDRHIYVAREFYEENETLEGSR